MNKCININHPEFKKLVEQSKMNPLVLKSKVGVWQEKNNTDEFPSMEELLNENKTLANNVYEALEFGSKQRTIHNQTLSSILFPLMSNNETEGDILKFIAQNKKTSKFYNNLAQLILDKLHDKTKHFRDKFVYKNNDPYLGGYIYNNTIWSNDKDLVFIHEYIHKITNTVFEASESSLKPYQLKFKNEIKRLYYEVTKEEKYINKNGDEKTRRTSIDGKTYYGLKTLNEFVSEAFSNIEFAEYLQSFESTYKSEHSNESLSLLEKLYELFNDFLNIWYGQDGFNVHKDIIDETIELIENLSNEKVIDDIWHPKPIYEGDGVQMAYIKETEKSYEFVISYKIGNKYSSPIGFLGWKKNITKEEAENKLKEIVENIKQENSIGDAFIKFPLEIEYQITPQQKQQQSDIERRIQEEKEGVQKLFESNPELANAVYSAMGFNVIKESEITYTDEDGKPCAKMGLTNTTKGTDWKIVKDFKGKPKHSQGGVDITISNKGVSMRRGGKDIKAKYGLLIPNNN